MFGPRVAKKSPKDRSAVRYRVNGFFLHSYKLVPSGSSTTGALAWQGRSEDIR